jgi:hypothetical protein
VEAIKRGEYKIIRVDGTEVLHEEKPVMGRILKDIGADLFDTVILDRKEMVVMLVDDTGHVRR